MEAVASLMYLVEIFSKESFLKEKEDHLKVLTALMESINYMIAYSDEGNEELFLSLVRHKSIFQQIASIDIRDNTEPIEEEKKTEEEQEVVVVVEEEQDKYLAEYEERKDTEGEGDEKGIT